ncbi:hypothetical protein FRC10_006172 [Ceratobasidium sp. 414]|nr:hypothetical protein FRC10_006172 [Ceratobasidium sp. 414]
MILIPKLIWLGNTSDKRRGDIASIGDTTIEAAAAAIQFEAFDRAVEWLEEGRSIVWKQILQLRNPLDDLSTVDFSLATQLRQVAHKLEQARSYESGPSLTSTNAIVQEQATQQLHSLAANWDELLSQARRLPNFHNLLKPQPFSELVLVAKSSTVVVINVHKSRCDAIAVLSGSTTPIHIQLPSFSHDKAAEARAQLSSSLHNARTRSRSARHPVYHFEEEQDYFRAILATLWLDVVEPILGRIGYLKPRLPGEELPHIIWSATGSLSFLPLHAAGCYDEPQAKIFDYVVSSYIPTLSALLRPVESLTEFRGILGVGQAAAAGSEPLPGTVAELDRIQKQAGYMPFTRLDGDRATPGTVLDAMETHSWIHLACHALQDASNPTASAFQLHHGKLDLATITRKSLKHADFAFLSACQTATGNEELPDEAIHLAAGMVLVGYSAVIATMWSIRDQDAPIVAERVYAHMLEGGVPDSRKAAMALHGAVQNLRDQVGEKEFARWVPYIHMGQ